METLLQDLRYGLRTLAAHPGFAAVVVVTMSLGIGANSAIFSVLDGVVLRPLPYKDGHQIVSVRQQLTRADVTDTGFSAKEVLDYRAQSKTLSGLVEYHNMYFILLGRAEPERVATGVVSAEFFDVMGVKPLLGRTFRADDDKPGADAVLILSHHYWMRSFGGDRSVVGKVFEMNDRPHTVVGVLPPVPEYPRPNDVYMPTSACPFRSSPAITEDRNGRMVSVFGRVKPDVALEQTHSISRLSPPDCSRRTPSRTRQTRATPRRQCRCRKISRGISDRHSWCCSQQQGSSC